MEKKTMGSFLAALRRANGMTQKELAERLNVSDKSVSRWERDDGAPDLALIPVIAEVFGVTCDELLRGERAAAGEEQGAQSTPKGEQQKKHLLAASLASCSKSVKTKRTYRAFARAATSRWLAPSWAFWSRWPSTARWSGRCSASSSARCSLSRRPPFRPCSSMPRSLPYTTRRGRMWTPSAARSSAERSGPTGLQGCSLTASCRSCRRIDRSR